MFRALELSDRIAAVVTPVTVEVDRGSFVVDTVIDGATVKLYRDDAMVAALDASTFVRFVDPAYHGDDEPAPAPQTCSDRVADERKARELQLDELFARVNADDADEANDELMSLPLEVTTTTTLKVLLSTGGPADYLTADIERGKYGWNRSSDVTYHFADWFDHASEVLDNESSLVTYFDSFVELHPVD